MKFTIRHYNPGWGSHIPLLVKALNISDGPVLELGMGPFSTPVMHLLCADKKRQLFSYETDKAFFDAHQEFATDLHILGFVSKWQDVNIENTHWGVALVDQHPTEARKETAIRLAKCADYVILHDTNGRFDRFYHYSEVYPHYKYRFIYDRLAPHSTIISNYKDLTDFI